MNNNRFSAMNLSEAYQIRIVDYLKRLGYDAVKINQSQYWYHSPLHPDAIPSFKVNDDKNLWYDFGNGHGGNIIELCKHLHKVTALDSILELLSSFDFAVPFERKEDHGKLTSIESVITYDHVNPLSHPSLLSYLKSRFLYEGEAKRYCLEIYYSLHGKPYYGIAFPNNSGGYEIRNPYFKGCFFRKDISLIHEYDGNNPDAVCLFEGFMDFLSYKTILLGQDLNEICVPDFVDYTVMNSVNNMKRVIQTLDNYSRIHCYLDNDLAGQETVNMLKKLYPGRIFDESVRYQNFKDLNDYLCGKPM